MKTNTPQKINEIIKSPSTITPEKSPYIYVIKNGYTIAEHKFIWESINGKILKGREIHHINGNPKDNRIENLECLSKREHRKKHLLPNRIRIRYAKGIAVTKIKENLTEKRRSKP